jgi:hypothetical protein
MMNTPHDQIVELVKIAVGEIARRRAYDGFYKDDEESRSRYYFPTLEGLEAILIPSLAISGAWENVIASEPATPSLISKDLEYVLSLNRSAQKKQKQDKQGEPYFSTGRGAGKKYFWISECAAFTLSTLINILSLDKSFAQFSPSFNRDKLRQAIKRNVDNLLDCRATEGGWSWSKGGKTPDAWATWSVIETFTDYLDFEKKYAINLPDSKRIKNSLIEAAQYLRSQLEWRSKSTIAGRWHTNVYKRRVIQSRTQVSDAYSFVHTMISSSLLNLQRYKSFRELASQLFEAVESVQVKNVENLALVASKKREIDDYSLHPTLLRAVTSIYVRMTKANRQQLKQSLEHSPAYYIKKQFERLMKSYRRDGEWAGLWGHNKRYEIYYSERTIEALVSLVEFLACSGEVDPWEIPPAKIRATRDDIQTDIQKLKKTLDLQLKG